MLKVFLISRLVPCFIKTYNLYDDEDDFQDQIKSKSILFHFQMSNALDCHPIKFPIIASVRMAGGLQIVHSCLKVQQLHIKHWLCLSIIIRRGVAKSFEVLDLELRDDVQAGPGPLPCQRGDGNKFGK